MASTVFADLARRAQAQGADYVQFEVHLDRFNSGPEPGVGMDRSWCASAGKSDGNKALLTRFGRAGEEAFRNLVTDLEKRKPT